VEYDKFLHKKEINSESHVMKSLWGRAKLITLTEGK
jgi:hypothetical protein